MLEGSCLCGSTRWRFDGVPGSTTICSCSVCRRYGTLWASDFEGERIHVLGETAAYMWRTDSPLTFEFCSRCGCVVCWRGTRLDEDGKRRIAVNLRLAEPEAVAGIVLDIFDGLDTFEDLPRDGRCVGHVWS